MDLADGDVLHGHCADAGDDDVLGAGAPTIERRGFLPMATTRGDRLFIGLLGAAWIHLGWLMA